MLSSMLIPRAASSRTKASGGEGRRALHRGEARALVEAVDDVVAQSRRVRGLIRLTAAFAIRLVKAADELKPYENHVGLVRGQASVQKLAEQPARRDGPAVNVQRVAVAEAEGYEQAEAAAVAWVAYLLVGE